MRVLQVSHSAQEGGSNEVLASLVSHAPAEARQACVFLEDGPFLQRMSDRGVPCALVPAGRARHPWRVPRVVRQLREAIAAHRADLVLAHVSKAHVYAAPAAALARVPELWWQHERQTLNPWLQELAGRIRAAGVICSSEWTATIQAERWPGTPVHVVHPGVPATARAGPRMHRTSGEYAEAPVIVGVVGRLARWKRVELALRALPHVLAVLPEVELRVIGGGSAAVDRGYAAELRAEASRMQVSDAVRFLGHVADGPAAIDALDILVHCADQEPFGLALVEALLAGVPVVASRDGGPREIVRDGVDGLLVDVTDAHGLAAAIVALARDPARRAAMGNAGYDRALERFTADRMATEAWAAVTERARCR